MIPFDRALEIVLAQKLKLDTETVPLATASGRFLAEEVVSPIDAPPFDKAAMDGYAVQADDIRDEYLLRATIAAGDTPVPGVLHPGEADKIMTGGPLPEGAGQVIRVEFTEPTDGGFRIITPEPYENIIFQGENIRTGDRLMGPCRLGPKEIGSLAASGFAEIPVRRRLKIGIITTGDELRPPGTGLGPGEIYDSNGPQLTAQIENAGAEAVSYGVVPDDRKAHSAAVRRGLAECDILLLSGGVSKGDFDYVPETLETAGVEELFHGVKVKPGRPTLFGRNSDTLVFGLPGNPVSVFIQFEALVRPAIHRLNGAPSPTMAFRGRLTAAVKRRDVDRAEFLPAALEYHPDGPRVRPIRYGGSSHLNALAEADALIFVPAGTGRLEEGGNVDARLL